MPALTSLSPDTAMTHRTQSNAPGVQVVPTLPGCYAITWKTIWLVCEPWDLDPWLRAAAKASSWHGMPATGRMLLCSSVLAFT